MSEHKFQDGDRVKVRGVVYDDYVSRYVEQDRKGVVVAVIGDILSVTYDGGDFVAIVRSCQCTKLYTVDRGPWKIGKKVRVFGTTERLPSDYWSDQSTVFCYRRGDHATIVSTFHCSENNYEVSVELDKGGELIVHSKQLSLVEDDLP